MKSIGIIGGGPAGLRAAEVAASAGASVTVYDAQRSVGRKFLVAGKSGLNLTHAGELDDFLPHYSTASPPEFPSELWRNLLANFDNQALQEWAQELGIETFTASSGKIFPGPDRKGMKAAPLLRRWISRLRQLGVTFKLQHTWTDLSEGGSSQPSVTFSHKNTQLTYKHDRIILALGGASWPQTGSTGTWTKILTRAGIRINPLVASNCGWETDWPPAVLKEAEGLPMKNLIASAGKTSIRGEIVITRYGLEGAPIYKLGPELRLQLTADHPPKLEIHIDFKPDLTHEQLIFKLGKVKRNFVREARRRWKLDPATCALLKHLPNRGPWRTAEQLAHEVKHCCIPLTGPRPIAEAISSAGGIAWDEITEELSLKKLPNIFVAGEMIDWDAPTGGYLLQGCFSTGTHVGHTALTSEQ